MATLRIAAIEGATTVFLTSLGGTTGTPSVGGYALTQVTGLIHDATITGLTGPFYVVAEDDEDIELGYVTRVVMVDDSSLIDTTDTSPSTIIAAMNADPPEVRYSGDFGLGRNSSEYAVGTQLQVFVGETISQVVTAYELDGITPYDLSGIIFELRFESRTKLILATISNENISISGANNNIVTFNWPIEVTESKGLKFWSLRELSSPNKVYLHGTVDVLYTPKQ